MYPIGFLFGLGFDTATEIGLLGISATQAAQGMSFWTIEPLTPRFVVCGRSLISFDFFTTRNQ
jgi:high-affinity nickel-transport protein